MGARLVLVLVTLAATLRSLAFASIRNQVPISFLATFGQRAGLCARGVSEVRPPLRARARRLTQHKDVFSAKVPPKVRAPAARRCRLLSMVRGPDICAPKQTRQRPNVKPYALGRSTCKAAQNCAPKIRSQRAIVIVALLLESIFSRVKLLRVKPQHHRQQREREFS